jgi:hypothetical protein
VTNPPTGDDDLSWDELNELSELEMKRSLRKAIRRGVIRTAFLGAVIFFIGSIVIFIGASLLRSVLGNSQELERVASIGWRVAHPNFAGQQSGMSMGGWTSTYTIQASPLVAQPSGATTSVRLTENPFGSVSGPFAQMKAPSDYALSQVGAPGSTGAAVKAHERDVLKGLPSPVRVAAVIQFATPMDDNAWLSFTQHYEFEKKGLENGFDPRAPALLSSYQDQFALHDAHVMSPVYGWVDGYDFRSRSPLNTPVAGFRKWVATLHNSDRDALYAVGADLDSLRAAAKDGHIYGFIVSSASVPLLLDLLNDPAIGAVHPYDVAFNVSS